MKKKMYTTRDTKAEVYGNPFYMLTHGEAERTFKRMANDKDSMIGQHPTDYDLYYLGDFDPETGNIKLADSPQHITKAIHLVDAQH